MARKGKKNPFCTNIVMLHIKSKVMKSGIQGCKNFARGGGGWGGMSGDHQRLKSGTLIPFLAIMITFRSSSVRASVVNIFKRLLL